MRLHKLFLGTRAAAFRARLAPDDRLPVEVGTNAYFFHDQMIDAVAEVVLVSTYQFAVIAKSKKKTDRADAILLALPETGLPTAGRDAGATGPSAPAPIHGAGSPGNHGAGTQEHGTRRASSAARSCACR